MGFTTPWLLVGLVAAALPILLHLVQRREPPEVAFPAVRYLEDATRDHRRRVKLRHLFLLLLRTLLIIAVVLAAAGLTMRRGGIGRHAPSALVLVLDNSASSAAVVDGEATLVGLRRAARAVLDRATPADRLWLVTADGIARAGTASELRARVDATVPSPLRLDLGQAIAAGRDLLRTAGRPGEVVVVSDLQRTALGPARGRGAVLALRPDAPPPANRAIAGATAIDLPWSTEGGRIAVTMAASDTAAAPLSLRLPGRGTREVLLVPGVPSVQRVPVAAPGWSSVTVALPPDELRLDDERTLPLRVAPPAAVRWDAGDRFVAAAMSVLQGDGRIRDGEGLRLGALGPGPSIVVPPSDPAQIGALNRALAARGVTWRYGAPMLAAERTDSGALLPVRTDLSRRVALEGSGDVLLTASGAPWLVRSGDVLLLGSRLDTAWTSLPLQAGFVTFLDAILTRAAPGALLLRDVVAGGSVTLPERVRHVVHDGAVSRVEGGGPWRPTALGVYHLTDGVDTLGAVTVSVDPRESQLARAADADARALWGADVDDLDDGPSRAFTAGSRADLRGPLLFLALCCLVAEAYLAGRAGPRS